MKLKLLTFTMLAATSANVLAADVINHKSPYCGCCGEWTKHMEENGFTVEEKLHDDMNAIKSDLGLKNEQLYSCHTAEIDGYVFEGHIPADDIKAFWKTHLATQRPDGTGYANGLTGHGVR